MIRIKPYPENLFICPECNTKHPVINKVIIPSVYILADCTCNVCDLEFYQAYPLGHTFLNVLSMNKSNGKFYQRDNAHVWLSKSFQQSFNRKGTLEILIKKIIYSPCEDVVVLNTLDSIYGHALLKLFNALHHLDHNKESGLIVIIPKLLEWLVPKGCAEVWVVDIKLSDLVYGHDQIQKFITQEFTRFKTIYLSRAYSHPALSDEDVTKLTGVSPFNLNDFVKQKPNITFILREDRIWYKSTLDYWFYRVCRKLNWLNWGKRILSLRQNQNIKAVIRKIKKHVQEANFNIIGQGCMGSFEGYANDKRVERMEAEVETQWCKIYSKSHVVIGVHGSNMILPTALAAGCVEILPEDRYGNIVQDITVRYSDRRQLFFYRFVEQFANPKLVANMATSIILDYDLYYQNMCLNSYKETSV